MLSIGSKATKRNNYNKCIQATRGANYRNQKNKVNITISTRIDKKVAISIKASTKTDFTNSKSCSKEKEKIEFILAAYDGWLTGSLFTLTNVIDTG